MIEAAFKEGHALMSPAAFAPTATPPVNFLRHGYGLAIGIEDDAAGAGGALVKGRHADGAVLAAAHAFQQATDWHLRRPPLLG